MNPNTQDISQTLMNNTLNAPWIGRLELKRAWIMVDEFIYFVSRQFSGYQTVLTGYISEKLILTDQPVQQSVTCLLHSGAVGKLSL